MSKIKLVKDWRYPNSPLIKLGEYYEIRAGYADSSVKFYIAPGRVLLSKELWMKSLYDNVPDVRADPNRFQIVDEPSLNKEDE